MDDDATQIGPVSTASGQLTVGQILNHTYKIIRFVSSGGMGEVYEAEHLVDGSRMAIKTIRPDLAGDDRIRGMFVHEAGILRRIKSDAVVGYEGLHRAETGDGFLVFLAMSYVDGLSLADRIKTRALNVDEATRLLERLAKGLSEVHAEGTFHRDLSPDNILLPSDQLDQAKIIDFGIAKDTKPQAQSFVGTDLAGKFSYMSPEQLGVVRQEVDARSDIYSLGLTIAAAMHGGPLPVGNSFADVCRAREQLPDLEGILEPLRGRLAYMLQPDPADRPQSMEALLSGEAPKKSAGISRRRSSDRTVGDGPPELRAKRDVSGHLKVALGGVAALLVVAVLGYLFLAPPQDPLDVEPIDVVEGDGKEEQPSGEGPSVVEVEPEPTIDLAAIEIAANRALVDLPCSFLEARIGDGGIATVSGTFGLLNSVTEVEDTLSYIQGVARIDTANVRKQIDPVCAARALIDRNAAHLGVNLRTNRVDSVFADGDVLLTYAGAPNGTSMHLHVDFIDPGGDVIHLKPNPIDSTTLLNGSSEIKMGAEPPERPTYRVGQPYGTAVVIAILSATPLFDTPRPHAEPARPYLVELEETLRQRGWDFQGGWLDIEIRSAL